MDANLRFIFKTNTREDVVSNLIFYNISSIHILVATYLTSILAIMEPVCELAHLSGFLLLLS